MDELIKKYEECLRIDGKLQEKILDNEEIKKLKEDIKEIKKKIADKTDSIITNAIKDNNKCIKNLENEMIEKGKELKIEHIEYKNKNGNKCNFYIYDKPVLSKSKKI